MKRSSDVSCNMRGFFSRGQNCVTRIKIVATTCLVCLGVLFGSAGELRAGMLLETIDIRTILASHGPGNISGLAFNPSARVFYLSHNPMTAGNYYTLGFIYTLDSRGALIDEIDLQKVYKPGCLTSSLSYDSTTGHLLIVAAVPTGSYYESRLLEMDPQTAVILNDAPIDSDGGGGITVSGNDIWQARFSEDIIRHYTRAGIYIEDVSVAGSFPGFPGPIGLAPSFSGGFYLMDFFNGRLVEVDSSGRELAAIATEVIGADRDIAIASDVNSRHIFLANNGFIYVLALDPKMISINIKPNTASNAINPKSGGQVAVAIRTTEYFEATTVDSAKVHFGKNGVEASPVRTAMKDADGDGTIDMILSFKVQDTGVACGDTTATLTGEAFDGLKFIGSDLLTVRCPPPVHYR